MKMITRRSFMQATAAVAATTALAACGSSSSSSSTTTVTSTTTNDAGEEVVVEEEIEVFEASVMWADGDEGVKALITAIVDHFNDAYPQYNLTIHNTDGGVYAETLQTLVAVDEVPDILEMRDPGIYYRAGMLAPIGDVVESLMASTVKFDGVAYTAARGGENTLGIIYNRPYFQENSLEEPKDWDSFIDLCENILALGDMDPLVVGAGDTWHIGFLYQCCYCNNVLVNDNDFIEHCYDGSENFSNENYEAALVDLTTILANYPQQGWASTEDSMITTFLVNDMCAMMYSGTHMFATIEASDPDFDMSWFGVHSRTGDLNLVGGGGAAGWSLNKSALEERPQLQECFDAFMTFFFSPEEYKPYCEGAAAIPTTVIDPELEVSEIFQTVIDAVYEADYLGPMWNSRVDNSELPSGFRDFVYKTVIEMAQGSRSIESGIEEIQITWDVAAASYNPVTGVGVTTVEDLIYFAVIA